jgi:hypothetical protein
MKALRHEIESLRQRIATLRGPEDCPARGYWTPPHTPGEPGFIIGSRWDPRVQAGETCQCWPEPDLPEEERAEEEAKMIAQRAEEMRELEARRA